jgi:hypothetical protein
LQYHLHIGYQAIAGQNHHPDPKTRTWSWVSKNKYHIFMEYTGKMIQLKIGFIDLQWGNMGL